MLPSERVGQIAAHGSVQIIYLFCIFLSCGGLELHILLLVLRLNLWLVVRFCVLRRSCRSGVVDNWLFFSFLSLWFRRRCCWVRSLCYDFGCRSGGQRGVLRWSCGVVEFRHFLHRSILVLLLFPGHTAVEASRCWCSVVLATLRSFSFPSLLLVLALRLPSIGAASGFLVYVGFSS